VFSASLEELPTVRRVLRSSCAVWSFIQWGGIPLVFTSRSNHTGKPIVDFLAGSSSVSCYISYLIGLLSNTHKHYSLASVVEPFQLQVYCIVFYFCLFHYRQIPTATIDARLF